MRQSIVVKIRRVRAVVLLMMIGSTASLAAQATARLRVVVVPTYDKHSWAVARALMTRLESASNVDTLDTNKLRRSWILGGAIADLFFDPLPDRLTNGRVFPLAERWGIAREFDAAAWIHFYQIPHNLTPCSTS